MCWQRALTLGNKLAAASIPAERSTYLQCAGGYNAGVLLVQLAEENQGTSAALQRRGGGGGGAHKDPDETVLTKVAGTVMTPTHPFDTQSAAASGPCALL